MTKRISALLLSVILCFAMLGSAFAAEPASAISAEAGSNKVSLSLTGLGSRATYYMCSLLVKSDKDAAESEYAIVKTFNFRSQEDGTFTKTYNDETIPVLEVGNVLRLRVPGVQFDGKDYLEYTIPEAKAEYKVAFTIAGSGTVTNQADSKPIANGDTLTVKSGESVSFTAVPAAGSELVSVTVDGKAVSAKEGVYTVAPTADAKVVVTFAAETVKITLDPNGGQLSGAKVITAEKGKAIGRLPEPDRSGYRFLGWFTEKDGGTEVTASSVFNADATIYAHWQERGSSRPSGGGGGSSGPTSTTPRVKDTNPSGETVVAPDGTPSFTDVDPSFWAYNEITWAATKGIMNGYGGGLFRPDRMVTRQQLWMVLGRLNGSDPADMAAARTWAISNGVSDGTNPTNTMTRQQMVTMLYRYAQLKGYAVTGGASISGYPDAGSVASYAQEAMAWGVGNGIVGGTSAGLLNPAGTASRAHFAVFLYRFCTHYGIA